MCPHGADAPFGRFRAEKGGQTEGGDRTQRNSVPPSRRATQDRDVRCRTARPAHCHIGVQISAFGRRADSRSSGQACVSMRRPVRYRTLPHNKTTPAFDGTERYLPRQPSSSDSSPRRASTTVAPVRSTMPLTPSSPSRFGWRVTWEGVEAAERVPAPRNFRATASACVSPSIGTPADGSVRNPSRGPVGCRGGDRVGRSSVNRPRAGGRTHSRDRRATLSCVRAWPRSADSDIPFDSMLTSTIHIDCLGDRRNHVSDFRGQRKAWQAGRTLASHRSPRPRRRIPWQPPDEKLRTIGQRLPCSSLCTAAAERTFDVGARVEGDREFDPEAIDEAVAAVIAESETY